MTLETFAICVAAGCVLLMGAAYLRQRRTSRLLLRQLLAATETQRTQDSLLIQRSQLDTIKDEFISTVSHELRTPLTSIRGALGLLSAGLMGTMDAKAQNLLRIAVTNTDRLIRLINDILDLERMQSGRAPLYIRRCALDELALQAIETMTSMAEFAEVRLELLVSGHPCPDPHHRGHSADLLFDGDPDRMIQVLTNLLSNAIKFSPPKSTVRVEIDPEQPGSLRLSVRDQGRGIPDDKLDSIFDRFGQVEASDARQKGGTGLGLAICRTIIQQHDGNIWAESNASQMGPGACLVISLPRTTRSVPAAREVLSRAQMQAEATILVCDDDESVRTVVAEHLRRRGYTVVEAGSGMEAIERASGTPVSAILLDLYMPGMSGWETLHRLKNTPATASIPVVILSVLAPRRRAGERQGGAAPEGWITKPFNENVLLAELSRVLHTGEGPAHILLVEDDHDLADVIVTGFSDAQVRVDHASTYSEAVLHCRLSRPDLLILDLTLPDGDGFTLVAWLRQQPELKTLPLVVYSGREMSDTEMSQLRLGPTEFLTKAKVQPEEVEELVFKMVQNLRVPRAEKQPTEIAS